MKLNVRSDWSTAVLVCSKCSKKLDGGFGPKGKEPLAKALRKHLGLKKGRKARAGIVEVKCLGICPRGAVAVVDTARPHHWTLVPAGADLDEVAGTLGLEPKAACSEQITTSASTVIPAGAGISSGQRGAGAA